MPIIVTTGGGAPSGSNYGALKSRIASELHRPDLLTSGDIANHVLSAVQFYAGKRFWGNETQWPLTTISGTKYYGTDTAAPGTLPSDIVEIDSIATTVNSRIYRLRRATFTELEDIDVGNTTLQGYPREWSWFKNQLRLYPTPNGAYTLTLSGQYTLTILSLDADQNFWTEDAEPLIRARAKKTICLDILGDDDGARRQTLLEKEALQTLTSDTNKLIATGRVEATRF